MDKSLQVSWIYDKIAEPYAREFLTPSEHIEKFLALLPENAKILDVGCGVGVDAHYMMSEGFQVTGIDLSKEMITLAEQKYPQIDFRNQDIRELDYREMTFDGIVASYSLIHIPKKDILELLKNFYLLLKHNGKIYISLQGGISGEIYVREPFKPDEELFLNIVTFQEIKKLLRKAGFSIVKNFERPSRSKVEFDFTKLFIIAKK